MTAKRCCLKSPQHHGLHTALDADSNTQRKHGTARTEQARSFPDSCRGQELTQLHEQPEITRLRLEPKPPTFRQTGRQAGRPGTLAIPKGVRACRPAGQSGSLFPGSCPFGPTGRPIGMHSAARSAMSSADAVRAPRLRHRQSLVRQQWHPVRRSSAAAAFRREEVGDELRLSLWDPFALQGLLVPGHARGPSREPSKLVLRHGPRRPWTTPTGRAGRARCPIRGSGPAPAQALHRLRSDLRPRRAWHLFHGVGHKSAVCLCFFLPRPHRPVHIPTYPPQLELEARAPTLVAQSLPH